MNESEVKVIVDEAENISLGEGIKKIFCLKFILFKFVFMFSHCK